MSSTSRIAISGIATEDFSTWNIHPAAFGGRIQGETHDDLVRERQAPGLSGVLKLDENDYTHSTIEVSIPAASVSTVDDKLDAHLKEADFFDVDKFPTLTFKSTSIRYPWRSKTTKSLAI